MSEAISALFGVLIGSMISVVTVMVQIFHQNKDRRIERTTTIFNSALNAVCEILNVLVQDDVVNVDEHLDVRDRERDARLRHFQSVAQLRLIGYDKLADEIVEYLESVWNTRRDKITTEAGWDEIRKKGYLIVSKAAGHIKDIENKKMWGIF